MTVIIKQFRGRIHTQFFFPKRHLEFAIRRYLSRAHGNVYATRCRVSILRNSRTIDDQLLVFLRCLAQKQDQRPLIPLRKISAKSAKKNVTPLVFLRCLTQKQNQLTLIPLHKTSVKRNVTPLPSGLRAPLFS